LAGQLSGVARVIDISEIVGTFGRNGSTTDVCATATGGYDDDAGVLKIKLDSFIRLADVRVRETHETAPWLPRPQTVTERVSRDEAGVLARDIFHRWAARVRGAIPSELQPHLS
jgi:hypothetical protein